ncbi:MAG TPA: phosphatidylglycerol lysyltransferase domain-containing protein [Acidimicrobiales bacterium]|nr:phosphatidylglycerol lysyltransferase domain-containing protein [Acidimicrobiales bacterium]
MTAAASLETTDAAAAAPTRSDDEPEGTDGGVQADLQDATRVDVPLGRRVMVAGDLLLSAVATPSSRALAADLARTLERWQGPGTVIVCGNLFAGAGGGAEGGAAGGPLDAAQVRDALDAHRELADAARAFTARPDRRLLVLPGWRDPEVGSDPAVVTELYALGLEVAAAVDLHLVTSAGDRRVLVRPGRPATGTAGVAGPGTAERRPWLAGVDRLEDPGASGRFVSSRTLYRRLGRFVWVPPLLAVVVAVVIRMTVVFHGVYHLVHRASGPRTVLVRAYAASWPDRVLCTVLVVLALELVLAAVVAVVSRRIWRASGGGALPAPWARRPPEAPGGPSPSSALAVGSLTALDEARALVGAGLAGLVAGGDLRAELAHLGPGFFACPGGTTELVREHRGRLGLPPVFLPHCQAGWVELETGADLHVRLLLADAPLPTATTLERVATGDRVAKGRKPAADLHPAMAASWPRGASWPPAPAVAADRRRVRRVRRLAAAAIFVAGLFDLLVAVSRPAASHLRLVHDYLPLGVSQAAGALVALAGIGLMMLARGVLKGQWRAWLVAVGLLATSLLLHLAHGAGVGGLLLTLLVLLLLLAERDLFRSTADLASVRSAVATLVVGGLAAVGAAALAIELSGRSRRLPLPSWPLVLAAAAERLVGLQSVTLPDRIDDWVSPSLLAVGIALAVVALYLLTRPVVDRGLSSGRAAELRARDIVRRHGTGTLDYFALRDDKRWFFHRDSLVAYAVYGGVCLVSPDPIGPRSERQHVWDAFRRLCDRNGWGVGVMAAADDWLPAYRDAGMRHLYIGDEAVVDVRRFSLQGGKMKGLRQAVNRVARHGYTVRFFDPSQVTPEVGRPLVDLMGRNRRGDQERGFSMMLGRLFDPRDTGLLLTVVYGPDGRPAAMCQFVPSAAIGGYSLDLMRRDPGDHPNGLLDFALCSTIDHLRDRGQAGLSLNFAAMRSTLDGEGGDGLTQRVERWALRRMSGVLPIESLWKFNAKYEPDWLPRYVVYDAAELFVPTLVAIFRAESLSEVPVVGRFLSPPAGRRTRSVVPDAMVPGTMVPGDGAGDGARRHGPG